jgi:DNA-binding NtrC family response regulator
MTAKSANRRRVLVVDDEPMVTDWLKMVIEQGERTPPYEVRAAAVGARALELFKVWRPDVVLLDLVLPDIDGIALLRQLKAIDPSPEMIVISGVGTITRALEAGQAGAFFFIEKSNLDPAGIISILDRATGLQTERAQHERLKEQVRDQYSFHNIIGKSKKMRELFELVEAVAESDANILIQGENGVGKELIANAIHVRSGRANGPFIKINCAALPKELIESELFGYKKGAFTGATTDKVGLLELAAGGSLLLDEIGEMPLLLQTKLLRVLQEREYRPIGSDRLVKVDFRLICATNVDPEAAIKDGRLREDLYFRINTVALRVPPLRERTEDLPLLCAHFLEKFNNRYQKNVKGISPAAYHLLIRFRWPGNVRELENALERAVLVCDSAVIHGHHLPPSLQTADSSGTVTRVSLKDAVAAYERDLILDALKTTRGNRAKAARLLDTTERILNYKVRGYGIDVRRFKSPEFGRRAADGMAGDAREQVSAL